MNITTLADRSLPFTGERFKVYRCRPFSEDEIAGISRRFSEANANESKEEGWIDISVGKWEAHVEFDSTDSTLPAFRMECHDLPTGSAANLLFTLIKEANAYLAIGLKSCGLHELNGLGATAMLKDYAQITSARALEEWIRVTNDSVN